ncbi:hypothetical protein EUGRSUZ_H00213 [Eucalyptus grandis]|uniref:Uncharacterized protein n=2 Tax=Eucalyptus grandis TaxID=71139 RepID=A0ACC3JMY3_EUCGR|nr:hypothetical protein EUGRSUZ_H00213 [Eucalyptus grandis]
MSNINTRLGLRSFVTLSILTFDFVHSAFSHFFFISNLSEFISYQGTRLVHLSLVRYDLNLGILLRHPHVSTVYFGQWKSTV